MYINEFPLSSSVSIKTVHIDGLGEVPAKIISRSEKNAAFRSITLSIKAEDVVADDIHELKTGVFAIDIQNPVDNRYYSYVCDGKGLEEKLEIKPDGTKQSLFVINALSERVSKPVNKRDAYRCLFLHQCVVELARTEQILDCQIHDISLSGISVYMKKGSTPTGLTHDYPLNIKFELDGKHYDLSAKVMHITPITENMYQIGCRFDFHYRNVASLIPILMRDEIKANKKQYTASV